MSLGDPDQIERLRAFLAGVDSQAGANGASASTQIKTEDSLLFGQADVPEHRGNQNKRTFDETELGDESEFDVEPYDPDTREPFPKLPIYHSSFKWAEKMAKDVVRLPLSIIKASGYRDEETQVLVDKLNEFSKPRYPDAVRVGLLGDSGSGKSSLINSLLGVANLAAQGDDTESVTYVVQEFVKASSSQQGAFSAEIEFFSRAARDDALKQYLLDYYRHHTQCNEDLEDSEGLENEGAARTALDSFMALFSDRDEFANEQAARAYLRTASSGDDPRILKDLTQWTDGIFDRLKAHDGSIALTAANIFDLTDIIRPFTKTVPQYLMRGNIQCSPWPFVKLVRFEVQSKLLEQGIVLADLPGISDVNRLRVKSTQEYLRNCDRTIVVSKLKRVMTERSVHENLINSFRRKRAGATIMVCTYSDDIQPEKGGRRNTDLEPHEEETLLDLVNKQSVIADEIKSLKFQSTRARGNRELVYELKLKQDQLAIQQADFARQHTEYRIQLRNNKAAKGLKKKYLELTKDQVPLPVFCVSNFAYSTHLAGYSKDNPPPLSVNATGIPELRRYLYGVPSRAKFVTLEHHCKASLNMLLNTLQMSCSESKLKRREDLSILVKSTQKKATDEIDRLLSGFAAESVGRVLNKITSSDGRWHGRALRKCTQWAKYKPATYAAFCRRKGNWRSKDIPPTNWNQELLFIVNEDLEPAFNDLHKACVQLRTDTIEALEEVVNNLRKTLQADPAGSLEPLQPFYCDLNVRKRAIERKCDTATRKLQKELNTVRLDATTDCETSYLATAMEDVYGECKSVRAIKGTRTTLHQQRTEILARALTQSDGVFQQVLEGAEQACEEVLKNHREFVNESIGQVFIGIHENFSAICAKPGEETVESMDLRQKLRQIVPEARAKLAGPIHQALEEARTGVRIKGSEQESYDAHEL